MIVLQFLARYTACLSQSCNFILHNILIKAALKGAETLSFFRHFNLCHLSSVSIITFHLLLTSAISAIFFCSVANF